MQQLHRQSFSKSIKKKLSAPPRHKFFKKYTNTTMYSVNSSRFVCSTLKNVCRRRLVSSVACQSTNVPTKLASIANVYRCNKTQFSTQKHMSPIYFSNTRSFSSSMSSRHSVDDDNKSKRVEAQQKQQATVERLREEQRKATSDRNQALALKFGALVVVVLASSYAFVPLYQAFCQATGYGGTVQQVLFLLLCVCVDACCFFVFLSFGNTIRAKQLNNCWRKLATKIASQLQ
jgi:cation transport ATPase